MNEMAIQDLTSVPDGSLDEASVWKIADSINSTLLDIRYYQGMLWNKCERGMRQALCDKYGWKYANMDQYSRFAKETTGIETPISVRERKSVSYTLWDNVRKAGIPSTDRTQWLQDAVDNEWTPKELTEKINDTKKEERVQVRTKKKAKAQEYETFKRHPDGVDDNTYDEEYEHEPNKRESEQQKRAFINAITDDKNAVMEGESIYSPLWDFDKVFKVAIKGYNSACTYVGGDRLIDPQANKWLLNQRFKKYHPDVCKETTKTKEIMKRLIACKYFINKVIGELT